jgi:transcription initiation factor IIE alpha subunit
VSGLGRKPSKPYVAKKLLRKRKTMTATQMAFSLGVSERQSRRIMNRLVDIEFASCTGSTKSRKYHYIEGR